MADAFNSWLSAHRFRQAKVQRAGPDLGCVLAPPPRREEREQVLVVDLLFAVGELRELSVSLLKLRGGEREPQLAEAARERVAARVLAQHDEIGRASYRERV